MEIRLLGPVQVLAAGQVLPVGPPRLNETILHAGTAPTPAPARRARPPVVPAQLPADVYGFAGRGEHLARLDAVLAGAASEAPTAVVISAVSGTAGVGKPNPEN